MQSLSPIKLACFGLGAFICRRLFRFVRGDCDLRTQSARVNPSSFKGKIIWITGASSGIGAELARQLAGYGAKLILTSRREDALLNLASTLPCPRENIHILPLDLASDVSVIEEVARAVSQVFGGIDYHFNNAGRSTRVSANDLDINYVQEITHLNFIAPVALTRAILPALRESPDGGVIVNTSSIAAYVCSPLRSSYASSKAAIVAYFGCLDLEEPNIDVVNIYPGSVNTPISINAIAKDGKTFGRSDANILAGLAVERVVDRMLAAVSVRLKSSWIAKPKELMATRLANYLPSIWEVIAVKRTQSYRRAIELS